MPALPPDNSAPTTATFIQNVLDGLQAVPAPLAQQVAVLCRLAEQMGTPTQAPSMP
jgi:hypothetical protein